MTITSQTTTQTTHRATLAGGINVSLDPACFGATLTLSESGRALTLALTPEQVAEMAQWYVPSGAWPAPLTMTAFESCWFFLSTARRDALCPNYDLTDEDAATLRALARAYQETQP